MSIKLDTPLETASGLVFPNRLVKAAMAEGMADSNNDPGDKYITAYNAWSAGGWGGMLTGEMEVSSIYMGGPANICVKPQISQTSRDAWKRWALVSQQHDTPTMIQLVHPGRQSPRATKRGFFDPAIAPSPVALKLGDGVVDRIISKLMFGTPRAMSTLEIEEVVAQFANAAKLAYDSGFKGVQIHAAHGFLLTQFLSPKLNTRTDKYGGSPSNRARIVIEIIRAVRAAVPSSFCVGIKVNSADVGSKENLEESLEQIGLMVHEQLDFIEISGGSFENMVMVDGNTSNPKTIRTAMREAFFLDYAQAVRSRYPGILLMLTGGFRSRKGMLDALNSGACDIIGMGRPSAVWPHLPKDVMLNEHIPDDEAVIKLVRVQPGWLMKMLPINMVGWGTDIMYYADQILRLATGKKTMPPPGSV